jgi:hypothetical protein
MPSALWQVEDGLRILDHVHAQGGGSTQPVEELTRRPAAALQLDVARQQALGER